MESTIYYIENDSLCPCPLTQAESLSEKAVFGAITKEEWETLWPTLDPHLRFIDEYANSGATRLDIYEEFDYISLNLPLSLTHEIRGSRFGVYFGNNLLLFICTNDEMRFDIISAAQNTERKELTPGKLLFVVLDKLTADDFLQIETLEAEISELEESLITSSKKDCVKEIIAFRKKLLDLRRYYEQLFLVLQSMEENRNSLIGSKDLIFFKLLSNRTDRLLRGVHNLRDYVTQVREAYQAQVDIELNSVMKLFTVLTAIFLPLTLIVGWYGMNFSMPEYSWFYGYPFAILLSVAVIIISVAYFKKNKWF